MTPARRKSGVDKTAHPFRPSIASMRQNSFLRGNFFFTASDSLGPQWYYAKSVSLTPGFQPRQSFSQQTKITTRDIFIYLLEIFIYLLELFIFHFTDYGYTLSLSTCEKKFDINSECNFYEIIYKLWECVGYGIETEIKTKY